MDQVVVVGSSLAGLRAAETLRREGYAGRLHMVGDEPHRPYDRPPLSKQFLSGSWDRGRLDLVDDDSAVDLAAEWHLGVAAVGLDLDSRTVSLADGTRISFDGLVIATGARPRRLPGTDGIGGVHTLRTVDDSLAIRSAVESGATRVVVVGAGFIGAEVAATMRRLGAEVTMVEADPAPFARVLGTEMGNVVLDIHRREGVEVVTGVGVESISGEGRVEEVTLADGTRLAAELVVVGIGVVPNTDWLEGSGLEIDDGVVCDSTCLAAPGVVAAGDVARWPNERFGETMRVEHWDNAVEQGVHAARRLLAGDAGFEPYEPIPWFWTDQFDHKIQLAGRARGTDRVELVHGSIEERRFAAIYIRGDDLVGVIGFNRPRQVMQYRQMIAARASAAEALEAAAGEA